MNKSDTRTDNYKYFDLVMEHLDNDPSAFFGDRFVYPRQFEIHLPADHKRPCNLSCRHCQGSRFNRIVSDAWEIEALELLNKLKGKIPYHVYGGAYSEPLMNPYLITFLATTKKHNNHFGIHTNGTLLNNLEKTCGFITELSRLATDSIDYLSISLDGGLPESWAKVKGVKDKEIFNEIIRGIEKATRYRTKNAVRICYLISEETGTKEDFESIVGIARDVGVVAEDMKDQSLADSFDIERANYVAAFNKAFLYKINLFHPYAYKFTESTS